MPPASTPDTNAPLFVKHIMLPIYKFGPGMSHSVADGAGRYLEVAGYGSEQTGRFLAS